MAIASSTISPCLWFDDQLEEAAEFYTSIFPNSSVGPMSRYPDTGKVMAGEFTLDGTRFRAINGGPEFTFSEAVSFSVDCVDQAEVDRYWDGLLAGGGEESVCGWLKDRFGLSWQIVPTAAYALFSDPDPARARAATEAMLTQHKIVLADLEAAADAASRAPA
jgi:predicted 3-demethylubiquinone-9 3-methyltransferase (glyoxalase superfamily)